MTDDPGQRLDKAIKRRGFGSVADFARSISEQPGTVRQHINRASIPIRAAEKYARRLRVPLEWLLYGKGPSPLSDGTSSPMRGDEMMDETSDLPEAELNRLVLREIGRRLMDAVDQGALDMTPEEFGDMLDRFYSRAQEFSPNERIPRTRALIRDLIFLTGKT